MSRYTTSNAPRARRSVSAGFSQRRLARNAARAFTLLEILVVLAIIGLVAGLAISKIGGIFDGAKIDTAKLWVQTSVKLPLNTYKFAMGDYPSTAEGLQALITPPNNNNGRWRGPYLESSRTLLDPWNEPYQYAYPGTRNKGSFDAWSKGPDRQSGTEDDIGNWEPASTENK